MYNNISVNLFKNKKEKDTQPDYRGSVLINGEWKNCVAGWIKVKDDKSQFLSLSIDVDMINKAVENRPDTQLNTNTTKTMNKKDKVSDEDVIDSSDLPF